jgi:hypothetical protein
MSWESVVKATAVATARRAAVAAAAAPSCAKHVSTEMDAGNAARTIAVITADNAKANSTLTEPSGRRSRTAFDARHSGIIGNQLTTKTACSCAGRVNDAIAARTACYPEPDDCHVWESIALSSGSMS